MTLSSQKNTFENCFVFSCSLLGGMRVTPLFVCCWRLEVAAAEPEGARTGFSRAGEICTDKRRWDRKLVEESETIKPILHSRIGNGSWFPSCPRLCLIRCAAVPGLKRTKSDQTARSEVQPRHGVCLALPSNCSLQLAGLRLPSPGDREDVRLQEIREEENKEEERRIHGTK